jgi:hypothetical protein
MDLKKYATNRSWLKTPLLVTLVSLSFVAPGQCQSPLQTVDIGDQKLELWSVEKGSFVASTSGDAYPLLRLMVDDLQSFKDSGKMPEAMQKQMGMQYSRWEGTRVSRIGNTVVLGMLLRDKDGKVSANHLGFSVASRVKDQDGKTLADWPDGSISKSDCLLSERVNYSWDDPLLSPLVLSVPDKATTLESVEAFAVISPVSKHRFAFSDSELRSKARKSDGEVTIVPFEYQTNGTATEVFFEIFRPLPEMKPRRSSSNNSKSKLSEIEQAIGENIAARMSGDGMSMSIRGRSSENAVVAPNTTLSVSAARQFSAESSIKAELKLRSKDSKPKTVTDKKKIVGNIRVEASGYRFNKSDIQSIEVEILRPMGLESIEKFELSSVALDQPPQRASLQSHLASLEIATASPTQKSSTTVRTWKDSSGKFSVEAELLLFDGEKIVLKKIDGKTIEVPASRMSDADIKYLEKL